MSEKIRRIEEKLIRVILSGNNFKIISRIDLELNKKYVQLREFLNDLRNIFVPFQVILKLFFIIPNFDQINSLSKDIPSDDPCCLAV